MLKKELAIFTFGDLLNHFPIRHIDRTKIDKIDSLNSQMDFAQIVAIVDYQQIVGQKAGKRLLAQVYDDSGSIELAWFQGINWIEKKIMPGQPYLIYGRLSFFNGKPQMVHPEIDLLADETPTVKNFLEPVYPTTEKLKSRGLGARQIAALTLAIFSQITEKDIPENLPASMLQSLKFLNRFAAYRQIHLPTNLFEYEKAVARIKFEELFIAQLRMQMLRLNRQQQSKGFVFDKVGSYFNDFYNYHLPFQLTNAQKRVVKEIRIDTAKGRQMNRLLQGDVGSGKTIVAMLIMLLAADNGYQSCLMVPTEILARQHFEGITFLLEKVGIKVGLLTGSAKSSQRKLLLQQLKDGHIHLLIGTHAVIEDVVEFKNLGMVVIDEQHRFGVEQRARLWKKASMPPHILVMTATPIPRTLAMTVYGDLDYSIIDELPAGRQPISTIHRFESQRSKVMDFIKAEIQKGRQAYIVFPLIEESDKLDYENLMEGFENVKGYFPEPQYWISMVHGRQPAAQKETNMKRFVEGDTQIMLSTTVIEVGVNVPNASIMVIESAEKFGLSQLHQLRGRVGRGVEKSYCVLLSGNKLGKDARERLAIITATNNGFEIAEKDLQLRGPGEIEGTRQSGALNFKLASIVNDRQLLETAQSLAANLLEADIGLTLPENFPLKNYLISQKNKTKWGLIS